MASVISLEEVPVYMGDCSFSHIDRKKVSSFQLLLQPIIFTMINSPVPSLATVGLGKQQEVWFPYPV